MASLGKSDHALNTARTLELSAPVVMGVLNVTPDSFSDGGCFLSRDAALLHVEKMIADGAAIIDVGGESTRPGAQPVTLQQEMDRVLPVVSAIHDRFDVAVSIDTSSPGVMAEAASAGATIINDVRALRREGALQAAQQSGLTVCLMHMQGEPGDMQQDPQYGNVTDEVVCFLSERIDACVRAGIPREKVWIDPGYGFGKTVSHNLTLLHQQAQLQALGCPVLVGWSRKSTIGHVLNRPVDQRLAGSLALAVMAVERGARIVRAHDVRETYDAIRMAWSVMQAVDQ